MQLRYFAWLREKTGTSAETVLPPPEITTVAELIGWLRRKNPAYAAAFANQTLIRCAVDQEFATLDTVITGAAEIGFFPPVTGG